jgi:hypothetical protein
LEPWTVARPIFLRATKEELASRFAREQIHDITDSETRDTTETEFLLTLASLSAGRGALFNRFVAGDHQSRC